MLLEVRHAIDEDLYRCDTDRMDHGSAFTDVVYRRWYSAIKT